MNAMNQANRNYTMQNSRYGQSCAPSCRQKMNYASMNQAQLLNHINEVSFAAYDAVLYLDTHPTDCEALSYYNQMQEMRNEAVSVYSNRFAPLTLDFAAECGSNQWEWIMQPWPWESMCKGGCR